MAGDDAAKNKNKNEGESIDHNSPLYLHASDYPKQMHVNEVLTDKNYSDWEQEMMNFLFAKNKTGFIDGTIKRPEVESVKYLPWMRCDAMIKGWLTTTMACLDRFIDGCIPTHLHILFFVSMSRHSASLIVSMSKDSKVRVWDASISSSGRNSSCVGMTSVPGVPVAMKCHDSLLYMAAGSFIEAVDLRTMRRVFRTSTNQGKLYSFDIMPSRFLACTGGLGRAMLWDIRRSTGTGEADPMAELDGHIGPVTHLHMDPYKIVTGGPEDPYVNIWQADTGNQTNSLICSPLDSGGCYGLAADGFCIVTAGYNQDEGVLRFRDFNNAVCSGSSSEQITGSKFWGPSTSTVEDNDIRRIYFIDHRD